MSTRVTYGTYGDDIPGTLIWTCLEVSTVQGVIALSVSDYAFQPRLKFLSGPEGRCLPDSGVELRIPILLTPAGRRTLIVTKRSSVCFCFQFVDFSMLQRLVHYIQDQPRE